MGEVELISKLRPHSNIVQFFGICLNPLCVIAEFLEKGDLRNYLDKEQNEIDQQQMMKWINQIAIGNQNKKICFQEFLQIGCFQIFKFQKNRNVAFKL